MTHLPRRVVQEDKGENLLIYALLTGGVSIFVFPDQVVYVLRHIANLIDIFVGAYRYPW